jgi:phage tail protein X
MKHNNDARRFTPVAEIRIPKVVPLIVSKVNHCYLATSEKENNMPDQSSFDTVQTGESAVIPFRRITTGSHDTLMSLAQRFYQNVNRWPVIRQANPALQSYNGNRILPAGILVTIP